MRGGGGGVIAATDQGYYYTSRHAWNIDRGGRMKRFCPSRGYSFWKVSLCPGGGGQLFLGKPLHRRTTGQSPGTVTPVHGVYLRPHHRYTPRTGLETAHCVWALVSCAVCILLTCE